MGLLAIEITPALIRTAAESGYPTHAREGLLVQRVRADGPADMAGVQRPKTDGFPAYGGDVIVSVEGERVRTGRQLSRAVASRAAGDTLAVGILRAGSPRALRVTVGKPPVP